MLLTNIILLILLASGIFAGLDKLLIITLYIGIMVCSEILNRIADSIKADSKLVSKVSKFFKDKYEHTKLEQKLKSIVYFVSFFVWTAFIGELICLAAGHGLSVEDSLNSRLFCAGAYLILYFYSVFGIRSTQKDEYTKTLIPEAQWYRMLQYLSVYQFIFAVFFIAMYYIDEETCYLYNLFIIHDYSIFVILAYLFCLVCERLLDNYRILSAHLNNKDYKYEVPFFVSIIAASRSFKHSLIKTFELISGVDLSKSEMAGYIIDHVEPVTIIALLIFWLLSSIVIIPPDQEAIFYRMGKIVGNQSYKPGMHFKMPWPFESMVLYNPGQIKTLNIGFTPDPEKKHIIWSKVHSTENFFLLVGDGVEIVAVDMQLFYKVHDLYKFVTKAQNPEAYIEDLTYKLLTAATVSQNFDGIVSQNRDSLISDLRKKLQVELDKADLGVTAVEIVILAIHPPLEVAAEYEDVISAQIDKQMYVLKANTESIHKLRMKEAFGINTEYNAHAYAATTVANAIGEAKSFESRIIGYETDPELEQFRLKLDSLQKMAKTKNLYVIDKSFMRANDRILLNLQN